MSDDEPELSVDEFVEYCRTQAGLLSGKVETMSEEAAALLDDIDEEMAAIQERLDERAEGMAGTASPPSPENPSDAAADLADIEDVQSDLETKQALVEAKQARIEAFQALSAGYADLGENLDSEVEDGREAMQRVIEFEADENAPAYFDERRTVLEAAAGEGGEEAERGQD